MNEPRIIKKGKYYHVVVTHNGKQKSLKYLGTIWNILGMTEQEVIEKMDYTQPSIPKEVEDDVLKEIESKSESSANTRYTN